MLHFSRAAPVALALLCVSCGNPSADSLSPQPADTVQQDTGFNATLPSEVIPTATSDRAPSSSNEEPPIGPKGMRVFESDAPYRATYFKGVEMIEFTIGDAHGILRAGNLGVGDDGKQKPIGMLVVEPDPSATWKGPVEIMVPECPSAVEFADEYVTDVEKISVECVETGRLFRVSLSAGSVDAEG
jgi:hypothetical protein